MKKHDSRYDRTVVLELIVIFACAIGVFFVAGHIDALESIVEFSHQYEEYEIDEFITTALFLVFALGFFAIRRWRISACASKELQKTNAELQKAMDQIDHLKGILPICSSCKKIRDENDKWHPVESYISTRSGADFSHSVCPECLIKLYGDVQIKE